MVGLYPLIHPADVARDRPAVDDLLAARVPWLQFRGGTAREVLAALAALAPAVASSGTVLVVNDRADVARAGGAGVHVGQDDLPPAACRAILGRGPVIGFSTHDEREAEAALGDQAIDYLAFGPVYSTGSKQDARPVVGVERLRGVVAAARRARPDCPVVAIGGIDEVRAPEILGTGVDAVAAIGSLRDGGGRLDRARIAAMVAACRRPA